MDNKDADKQRDKPAKVTKKQRSNIIRFKSKPDIIDIPIPGLRSDGTWDKDVLSGRAISKERKVSCTFTVELDGDLAERVNKETARMALYRQWTNERRIQCLAPILWEQLKRDLDKWKRRGKNKDKE